MDERFGGFGHAQLDREFLDIQTHAQHFGYFGDRRAGRIDQMARAEHVMVCVDGVLAALPFDMPDAHAAPYIRPVARGGPREGGAADQGIGLAFSGAEQPARQPGREIRHAVPQVRGAEDFGVQPGRALDLRLAVQVAHLRVRIRNQDSARRADFQIFSGFFARAFP